MGVIELHENEDVDYNELLGVDEQGQQIFENNVDNRDLLGQYESNSSRHEHPSRGIVYDSVPSIENSRKAIESVLVLDTSVDSKQRVSGEAVSETLSRIRSELEALKVDETSIQEVTFLKELRDKLGEQYTTTLKELRGKFMATKELRNDEMIKLPEKIQLDFNDLQKILKLDARIRNIEERVGTNDWSPGNAKPIVTQLNELYRHLTILNDDKNGKTLSRFQRKLDEVSVKFEESLLNKKMGKEPTILDELNINLKREMTLDKEGLQMVTNLRSYESYLPNMVDRVRYIGDLNNNVVESLDRIRCIDSTIKDLQVQSNKWENTLKTMNEKLIAQEKNIDGNLKGIYSKIDELNMKLDKVLRE
ncbi:hypothetical protein KAFR_0I02490 [Kazachstania africana CBS 2517]|uniref:Uncharacterized protein n=1 Tax=Kazachstania africana (strain ATCC 22294 / BCRC 22015 / CBS 2517 / CECT 1963 / NBRC 1671 / NRRL Y-8276) TaxID=1071382 RepID=H2B078_KAZAF|nr:hypothetical protein KAFR_0I02490 [Kazachstania africana CBS 2517]CCF60028.1 hypothetical protein KAFR_0I02490 [Kazachstania africana CBS 2517]